MKRFTNAFTFLFLLIPWCFFSQSIVKGMVKDSLQNPLAFANVIAEPQDSLQKIKFSITDEQGQYFLELENIPYTVTTSYMGFKPFSFQVTSNKTIIKDIILKSQSESLSAVVIEMPVIVKEDTIIYNVEKLWTGEERKLKDILKNLPGVEVSKDGTVTVQGKKVTTLLVENKKFFGGGSKLAVENIPADAVEQVVVLDNYNEVAFLKTLQESDNMALNIKLKENKKNFVFGDIEAGKGNQNFYRTHGNLFYYSPKSAINAIGNLNNIREQVFTYKQYFDFKSGINSIFKTGTTVFNMEDDSFLQFIENDNVAKSKRQFGALNFTQEMNNKLTVSGYGIFSITNENSFTQSTNQYNTYTEKSEVATGTDNQFAIGNIKTVYLPNLTDQWYFKTQFKKTNNQFKNTINSRVDTINNVFLNRENARETFFNQSVEWHKKKSTKHTFSFGANYTFVEQTPRREWETSNLILEGLIPIVPEPEIKLKQLKRIKNNTFDAIFKHYWVLNRNNHIYSTIGNTYLTNNFFTEDVQVLDNGNVRDFSIGGFGNDLNFNLNDFFAGINYKFKTGIFTFDQGVFIHSYQWQVQQENSSRKNKIVVLPSFLAIAQFNRSKKLEFDYELKSSFADASNFADNFYLKSYNAITKGNKDLENELYHTFKLRYNKFANYKGIGLYATANFIKKIKGIQDVVSYQGVNQFVTPILLDNPETRWTFLGRIQKKIKDINFSAGLNYTTSKYLQKVDTVFETNKNRNIAYNLNVKTFFDDLPIVTMGFKQNFSKFTLSDNKLKFVTTEPFVTVEYDFWKSFIASFDYTLNTYKSESINNKYEIANASLYYKKESSAWSFKVEAQNVFNVAFKNQSNSSSYIISDTRYTILPRVIMCSVGYNL